MTTKTKVLYIVGPTRSGSTIFSNILNEVEGFFNAGELIEYWNRGLKWPCSCGTDTRNCVIWQNVIRKVKFSDADYARIGQTIEAAGHSLRVPKYMLSKRRQPREEENWPEMLSALESLYKAVQSVTDCEVLIDASKNPGYAFLLSLVPGIDLYLVHLIRDPRAVAYSWLQKKQNLWTTNVLQTSLVWLLRNQIAEMMGRQNGSKYIKLNYEYFVSKPRQAIDNVFAFLSVEGKKSPVGRDGYARIGGNHGLCGNPVRFDSGPTRLLADRRYLQMKTIDKILVTMLTMPGLLKYGYPLQTGKG